MTPTRQIQLQVLGYIQNSVEFQHQDIMTFTGFMSDDAEVDKHILRNFEQLSKTRQAQILGFVRELQHIKRIAA